MNRACGPLHHAHPDPTCRIFALDIIRRTAACHGRHMRVRHTSRLLLHHHAACTHSTHGRGPAAYRSPAVWPSELGARFSQVRLHPELAGLLGRGQACAGVSFSLDTCLPDISAARSIRGPDAMRLRKADHPRDCLAQRGRPTGCAKSACVFARARLRPISRLLFSLSAYTPTPAVFPMASSPLSLLFPVRLLLVFS